MSASPRVPSSPLDFPDDHHFSQNQARWYRDNNPNYDQPNDQIFKAGLVANRKQKWAANEEEGADIDDLFSLHITESRIYEQPFSDDHEERVKYTIEAIAHDLIDIFKDTPEGWIEMWVRALVLNPSTRPNLRLPYSPRGTQVKELNPTMAAGYPPPTPTFSQSFMNQAATPSRVYPPSSGNSGALQQREPEDISLVTASESEASSKVSSPTGAGFLTEEDYNRSPSGQVSLKDTFFVLRLHKRPELGKTTAKELKINTSRCFPPLGRNGRDPSSYSYRLFKTEFQKAANRGIPADVVPYNLETGAFTYVRDEKEKRIRNQKDFEAAITYLYNTRSISVDYGLAFAFYDNYQGTTREESGGTTPGPSSIGQYSPRSSPTKLKERAEFAQTLSTELKDKAAVVKNRLRDLQQNKRYASNTSSLGVSGFLRPLSTVHQAATREFYTNTIPENVRKEKASKLRRMFPLGQLPTVQVAEQALLECNGDVDAAFKKLGGKVPRIPLKAPERSTPKASPVLKKTTLIKPGTASPVTSRQGPQPTTSGPVTSQPSTAIEEHQGSLASVQTAWSSVEAAGRPGTAPKIPSPGQSKQAQKNADAAAADSGNSRISIKLLPTAIQKRARQSKPTLTKVAPLTAGSAGTRIPTRTITESPGSSRLGTALSGRSRLRALNIFSTLNKLEGKGRETQGKHKFDGLYEETRRVLYKSGGDSGYDPTKALRPGSIEGQGSLHSPEVKDVVTEFKELANLDVLGQLNEPAEGHSPYWTRWEECCLLFNMDTAKTGVEERVQLAGLKQPLFQYQAFAVFWQMSTSRSSGGGFMADAPGLGKTLVFLAFIVVEHQLSLLHEDVKKSIATGVNPDRDWETADKRHRTPDNQSPDSDCPSSNERPGWIRCPCLRSSPAFRMEPHRGVRLALVPTTLMANWRKQWAENIDLDIIGLDMRLLLAHPGGAENAKRHELAEFPDNIAALKSGTSNLGEKVPDTAFMHQERFLVLATSQGYESWISKFKSTREDILARRRTSNFRLPFGHKDEPKFNINIGIACVDEFHEDFRVGERRIDILARLPGNEPWCWALSGTPIENTPRSLQGILNAIEKQFNKRLINGQPTSWGQDRALRMFTHDVYERVCKEFDMLAKAKGQHHNKSAIDDLKKRFLPFLIQFMIRRTPDTNWYGHGLAPLKPMFHHDIYLAHNATFDAEIEAMQPELDAAYSIALQTIQDKWRSEDPQKRAWPMPSQLGYSNTISVQYKLKILATCPWLVKLTTGPTPMTLKNDELTKWKGKYENSPYGKNLQSIVESSPKLLWLRQFIIDLDKTKDVDGQEHKVLIMSQYNCICLLVKYMIETYIKNKKERVGFIHSSQSAREAAITIEAFSDETELDKDKKIIRRKHKENFQFLVGSTRQLGRGLQLTRASNVVLMEPDHKFEHEVQAFARVNRIGQRNPRAFSFRLIDEGSQIEEQIIERQIQLNQLPGKPVKRASDLKDGGFLDDLEKDPFLIQLFERDIVNTGLSSGSTGKDTGVPRKDSEVIPSPNTLGRGRTWWLPEDVPGLPGYPQHTQDLKDMSFEETVTSDNEPVYKNKPPLAGHPVITQHPTQQAPPDVRDHPALRDVPLLTEDPLSTNSSQWSREILTQRFYGDDKGNAKAQLDNDKRSDLPNPFEYDKDRYKNEAQPSTDSPSFYNRVGGMSPLNPPPTARAEETISGYSRGKGVSQLPAAIRQDEPVSKVEGISPARSQASPRTPSRSPRRPDSPIIKPTYRTTPGSERRTREAALRLEQQRAASSSESHHSLERPDTAQSSSAHSEGTSDTQDRRFSLRRKRGHADLKRS
ncbi:hypothetical protein B0O99DRAFT_674250 [Bisporella sp. PMI_857]|nr:hypothetical protein B0O99DRAFT_674250 [Bisporella sp. PMI_857]